MSFWRIRTNIKYIPLQRRVAGLAANEDLKKKKEDLERERDVRIEILHNNSWSQLLFLIRIEKIIGGLRNSSHNNKCFDGHLFFSDQKYATINAFYFFWLENARIEKLHNS